MPPDFLDSREDAILVWLTAIVAFAVYKNGREIGRSLLGVLDSFLSFKLLLVFGSAAAYTAALVLGADALGVWHTTATKWSLS